MEKNKSDKRDYISYEISFLISMGICYLPISADMMVIRTGRDGSSDKKETKEKNIM